MRMYMMISLMATSSQKGRGPVGAAWRQFDNALSKGWSSKNCRQRMFLGLPDPDPLV
jgi:hypothetical protein